MGPKVGHPALSSEFHNSLFTIFENLYSPFQSLDLNLTGKFPTGCPNLGHLPYGDPKLDVKRVSNWRKEEKILDLVEG